MPILKREQDVWPESLLETGCAGLPVGASVLLDDCQVEPIG